VVPMDRGERCEKTAGHQARRIDRAGYNYHGELKLLPMPAPKAVWNFKGLSGVMAYKEDDAKKNGRRVC